MEVKIRFLTLLNFKGMKGITIPFTDITNISGDNGTGKSTLFDAFWWLLFGKDSHGSTAFSIKTRDENEVVIPEIDHAVTGVMEVDGHEVSLKRVYREKWTRRRGTETSELTGHETLYYKDDSPMQAGEYKTYVDSIVNEGLFKLLTSPLYFNSLPWQDRRRALVMIAGELDANEVFATMKKAHVEAIMALINAGKDLAEFRKEIAVKKKKLSDDLKLIPSRIDEVKRGRPEPADFDQISANIYNNHAALLGVELTITNQTDAYQVQADEIQKVQLQISELKKKRAQVGLSDTIAWQNRMGAREMAINEARQKLSSYKNILPATEALAAETIQRHETAKLKQDSLRQQWITENAKTVEFDPNEENCPLCKQRLDEDLINDKKDIMLAAFNTNKAKKLSDINADGLKLRDQILADEKYIAEIKANMTDMVTLGLTLKANLETAELVPIEPAPVPTELAEYGALTEQIEALELQILETPKLNVQGLREQKSAIQLRIDALKKDLTSKDVIVRANVRIKELLAEEKSLSQQIADLEKKEFAMDNYSKGRMDMVEARINQKFTIVKWRMFSTLINGGTEEACDCMVNGIPFYDANSAGKIQAGIDIINTMSDHYGIYVPIIIDNRESINTIPETKSQIINLIVSKHKSLTII